MRDINVTSCRNCAFSSFSLAGGHINLIWTGRKRIQHRCNVQNLPTQYNHEGKYSCFNTCPLKLAGITISLINPLPRNK